jgi:formyl-CoA transferase
VIAVSSDQNFLDTCWALSVDPTDYPALTTTKGRADNREIFASFMTALDTAAKEMTIEEATARLQAKGVPFGVVCSIDEIPNDPQVIASRLFSESIHPLAGRLREPRPPVRFSGTPTPIPGIGPGLGEHTDEILRELGRTDGEELRLRGVIA